MGRTERGQVVLEVVREVVTFPGRLVVELDVHYMVRVLVCHLDHTDHIIRFVHDDVSLVLSIETTRYLPR